ncbi:complex I NDUFA9 subunit family protein [Alphaproteobacteria bacterium LSUCC0684]
MEIKRSTIAIIGGTGFIGRRIVEVLAEEGARIKVLARNADRAKFLKPMGGVGQISIISGNALNAKALTEIMSGADAVVNTIGILAESGQQRFSALQAELPGQIGRLAAELGLKKVVHLSAIGADPSSHIRYAASKGQGEQNLHHAFPKATILRPSLVFGEGDGFFNRFARMAVLAPGLPVIGGGSNLVQPVFVGDVAQAVKVSLANDGTEGQIFELGGPEQMSFRDTMAYILKEIRRRRALIPVPFGLMSLAAIPLGLLPDPPVTRDQLKQLKIDNIVGANAKGLADLGITPTPISLVVPGYLERFRPGGRFSSR